MKKIPSLTTMIVMILTLCSIFLPGCSNDEAETDTADASTVISESQTDINGYKIMRKDDCSDEVLESYVLLKKAVREVCGIELEVGTDYQSENPANRAEKEIIIGHTNLPEENVVYETLSAGEYAITKSGSKIIIVGYSDKETIYAVERFLSLTLNYDKNKYENTPIGTTVLTIPEEKQKAETVFYPVNRTVSVIEPMTSNIIPSSSFTLSGCRAEGENIIWNSTGSAIFNGEDSGEGSFRIEFTVDNNGSGETNVQLFIYFQDTAEHICASIPGSFVRVERATYGRGGMGFKGDPNHYTFRMDVHPDSGRMQYFIDGVFLGEMNIGESDDPLTDHAGFGIAVVGDRIDTTVSNIRRENIEDIGERRYDAPSRILTADDDIYPKSENAPAETIYVVNSSSLMNTDLLTLSTLQGNVNRTTPEIFMDYRSYNLSPQHSYIEEEQAYIDLLTEKGRNVVDTSLEELLVKFADRYSGVIVGDAFATVYGENVVTSLCGVLDAVYLTEKQYKNLKDVLKKDVLFRIDDYWDSPVEAYMWVWNTYGDKFSDSLIFHTPSMIEENGHNSRACRDYAVMARAFVFYTHGVECIEDYDFYLNLFATRAANSGIIGFGGGCFPEFEMFQVAGQFAKFWTYGFSTPNMSLFNSLEFGELSQKEAEENTELTTDTVYVTFDLSEGDNLSWNYHLWAENFANEEGRRAYPKGYSLCGALYYVAPALIEYFYDIATPNDYFFFDGGSISNIGSPDSYALMYRSDDREKITDEMLSILNFVCEKTDISILRALNNISEEMTLRIDEACPAIDALFSAYGNTSYKNGGSGGSYEKSIRMEGDIVRVRCHLNSNMPDLGKQMKDICRQARNDDGIVFAKTFIFANAVLDIADLRNYAAELESSGKNIVCVRPDIFAELYREYQKKE